MTYTVGFYDRKTEHFNFRDYASDRQFFEMWRHYENTGRTFKLMEASSDRMLFMCK